MDRTRRGRPGIDPEVYEKAFALVLKALREHKLLRGRKGGIDASVMVANASLRSLEQRLRGEDYREYVSTLAEFAAVDGSDPAAGDALTGTGRLARRGTTPGRTRTIRTRRSGTRSGGRRGWSPSRSTGWTSRRG